MVGAGLALSSGIASAQELTIFWAEWDPAELPPGTRQRVHGRDRRDRHGARPRRGRTSRPRPSPSSTPRAMPTTSSSATRQWLGAGSTGGHYVDLTEWFVKNERGREHGPGHRQVLCRVSQGQRQVLGRPDRGRRHGLVLSQGLVRGPQGDGGVQGQVRLRPRRPEDLGRSCATSPSSSIVPTTTATASRSTPTTPTTRWSWASRTRCSPTAAISATTRPTRSTASSTRPRPSRRSKSTANSTSSPRRTGASRSSSRTTRPSPKAWRR